MGSLLPAGAVRATARADTQSPLWHPEPAERSCAAGEAAPNGFLISSFIEGSAEIASRNLASEWDAFSALRPLGKARPGIRRQNGMCFPFAVFGGNCVPDPALRTGCAFRPPTSGAYVHLGAPSRARPLRHSSRFCATLQTVRSSVRTRGYTQNDTFPMQYDAGSACTIRRGQ